MILFGSLFTLAVAYALGVLCFRRLPLPHTVRLGLGAAIESTAVFLLLIAGWGNRWVFLGAGGVLIVLAVFFRPVRFAEKPVEPLDRISRSIFAIVMIAYTVLYAVHAAAPEVQADAITYHLGLTAEYLRLGHFPARVGFFEMLPQGLEMLFTVAFAFGRHSAAKLVHFAFLIGTVPLMFAIARRLALPDRVAAAAAALYFVMPVAGMSGASAYNDAALVFFSLAAFYLILAWRAERRIAYLAAAGLAAGFCYSVKITGAPIAASAVIAVLALSRSVSRSPVPMLVAAAFTLIPAAPWVIRALILTGNPVAPLMNGLFPNPYFDALTEKTLSAVVMSYHDNFSWTSAPMRYALRGGLHGTIGPLLFALPIGLLALRKKAGVALFLLAMVCMAPWFWNVDTRFLMPAIPALALMLALVLRPQWLLWTAVMLQAVLCWPTVIENFQPDGEWGFSGFPWRAALRIEPEETYLQRMTTEYKVAQMLQTWTPADARIFSFASVARAYTDRETTEFWHSTNAQQLTDALRTAFFRTATMTSSASWSATPLRGIRAVARLAMPEEWWIFETRLFSPDGELRPSRDWSATAAPRPWEAQWAFDGNLATAWRTRANIEAGTFLEVDFDRPLTLSRVEIVAGATRVELSAFVEGLNANGQWKKLADLELGPQPAAPDLRREATRALRRAGFRFLLTEASKEGLGQIGTTMTEHPEDWGLRPVDHSDQIYLFEVK